jgi:dolichol-phosphate mannosyltransferase
LLKPSFSDYTSGFVAARRHVLDEIDLRDDCGEYFTDVIYRVIRAGKYRVCELPYVAVPAEAPSPGQAPMSCKTRSKGGSTFASL